MKMARENLESWQSLYNKEEEQVEKQSKDKKKEPEVYVYKRVFENHGGQYSLSSLDSVIETRTVMILPDVNPKIVFDALTVDQIRKSWDPAFTEYIVIP
jgi:hypothetical protein